LSLRFDATITTARRYIRSCGHSSLLGGYSRSTSGNQSTSATNQTQLRDFSISLKRAPRLRHHRMPFLASRPCSNYPCSNLASYRGRCASCNASREQRRGAAGARGYDQDWRDARDSYLHGHPLCEDCIAQGFYDRRASEVHHKISLRTGGTRLDPENFRALCKSCHSKRTARGE
jgi:5-methylcytosine-specific restriction enzyme A